jgi:hypothetical protein
VPKKLSGAEVLAMRQASKSRPFNSYLRQRSEYANRRYRTQDNGRDEGHEMSVRGPGHAKRMAGEPITGPFGKVSARMTAWDIISLAVNVAQDKWSLGSPAWIVRRQRDRITDAIYSTTFVCSDPFPPGSRARLVF